MGEQKLLFSTCKDMTEHRKFEIVLKRSEEKYREMYQQAPIAFFFYWKE
jgi:hypothetical protein